MTEWFEQWFGEEYLRLYPHRDDEDAAQLVALIARHVPLEGSDVLDLACGPGRHAALLAAGGARVVGFDLSMPLLSRARHRPDARYGLVRGDMRRLPFPEASFDVVVNLFTSFGYFAEDSQHESVLSEIARVLRPGGAFVMDFLHAAQAAADLVPHEERDVGNRRVAIERSVSGDGRYLIKEIHVLDEGRSFMERVRLFSPDELVGMMSVRGFVLRHRVGDYEGAPLGDGSPRAILFMERI